MRGEGMHDLSSAAAEPGWLVFLLMAVAFTCGVVCLITVGARWMANWRERFTHQTREQAREFFVFIDPARFLGAQLVLSALTGGLVFLTSGSGWLVLAAIGLTTAVPGWAYRTLRARRLRRFDEQLPDALLMLAGALRAGVGLPLALSQVVGQSPAPLGQEFSLVLREQRLGVPLDQALTQLQRRVPTASALLLVSGLRIAIDSGGALAETLERISATVRGRLQMEGKIDALTSQGRLQAWVVGALPLLLMAVLHRLEPQAMSLLWTTSIGWGVLGLIACLLSLGMWLIRRIVAIDV